MEECDEVFCGWTEEMMLWEERRRAMVIVVMKEAEECVDYR